MASSGWQNEQWVVNCNGNVSYYGNIYIKSITHTGTNLRVVGGIALCTRGTSGYRYDWQNNIYANLNGTDHLVRRSDIGLVAVGTDSYADSGRAGGSYFDDDAFDATFTNVSATATSYEISVNFHSYQINKTLKWTLSIPSSASAPSGLYANNISATWNSVSGTVGLTSYGSGGTGYGLELIVLTQPYTEGKPHRYSGVYDGSMSYTTTVDNNSTAAQAGSITIKGCGLYYCGVFATNGAMATRYQAGSVYTKPAPSQFSYTDPGGTGSKTYPVTFVGDTVNNNTSYDTASLARTIRYKIDNGSWVYVDNETVALLDYVTSFNVTVPAGSVATIEGWMTYHGGQSEVRTITLANTNAPVHLYGSVNNASEEVVHLYGSVNGRAKKIKKLYASVGGVAKKVFSDE